MQIRRSFNQVWLRKSSTSASIGAKISNSAELDAYFSRSTWSTQTLLAKEDTGVQVDNVVLDSILSLSGLSINLSAQERSKMLDSLSQQLNFLTKLQKVKIEDVSSYTTRLVDDKSNRPVSFDDLICEIASTKPSLAKGEVENSWKPLSLTEQHQNEYYLVKEGLLKKNK